MMSKNRALEIQHELVLGIEMEMIRDVCELMFRYWKTYQDIRATPDSGFKNPLIQKFYDDTSSLRVKLKGE